MDSYDQIPYQSTPFQETHPRHLAVLARLFGIRPVDPEHCRVLEIGCASGGNLIPMAIDAPDSRFLGIELSQRQAVAGQQRIERLGLRNIRIEQGDLNDFQDPKPFDYIIAHGIYSWVPQPVRRRILKLCRQHLSTHGLAYISYNTLPGWRWRGILRDLLLFHCRDLQQPQQRLAAAQGLLDFLEQTLCRDTDSPQGRFYRDELRRIRASHPSYLYHEYLEAENHPLLFLDFHRACREQGLNYVCDLDLHTMFSFSLGDEVADWMEAQAEDLPQVWQYMDFLGNRGFRQSLLCRQELEPVYDIDLETFGRFGFFGQLQPVDRFRPRPGRSCRFRNPAGIEFPVEHPLTQAALLVLRQRYPEALGLDELTRASHALLASQGLQVHADEGGVLQDELFALFCRQGIGACPQPLQPRPPQGDPPRLRPLPRLQIDQDEDILSAAHHSSLQLDAFGVALARRLDGLTPVDAMIDELCEEMRRRPELNALLTPKQRQSDARMRQAVTDNCAQLLELFRRNGLLD